MLKDHVFPLENIIKKLALELSLTNQYESRPNHREILYNLALEIQKLNERIDWLND